MPLHTEFLLESIFGLFSLSVSTNICDVELWDSVTRKWGGGGGRELQQQRPRRQRKRYFKRKFALFQTLSPLFHRVQLIESCRIMLRLNRSFPSYKKKNSNFQNESKCKSFLGKVSFICTRIKITFMMASHLASLWSRGLGKLGKDLFVKGCISWLTFVA